MVFTHGPRFFLKVAPQQTEESGCSWLHPQSAAGRLYEEHCEVLEKFELNFYDPHLGSGGFGASGAEFVLLHGFLTRLGVLNSGPSVFEDFKKYDLSKSSGSDVLAQSVGGGVVEVSPHSSSAQFLQEWPFEDLVYIICPTHKKLNTHSHLQNIEVSSFESLVKFSEDTISAYKMGDKEKFLGHINEFQKELSRLQLVADHTAGFIDEISGLEGVRLVKGCGAMGSDSMIVLTERSSVLPTVEALKAMNLVVTASNWNGTHFHVATGLEQGEPLG